MMTPIFLSDSSGERIGSLENIRYIENTATFVGAVAWTNIPLQLLQLLDELEETVRQGSFAWADQLHNKIDALGLSAEFDDGKRTPIKSLYVEDDRVSFCLAMRDSQTPQPRDEQ
ncbi:MAG: hypothetical protein ABL921_34985 [Pirellula sp.]